MHIAGNAFTQKIADIFGLDFAEAEKLKLAPEEDKLNKIKAGVESALANLAGEVRTSFDYYESQGTSSVSKIYLSGGGAKFPGVKDMLAHFLNIEVECWDPVKKVKVPDSLEASKLNLCSGELAVAVGLALRGN
jgi:Tfp pilus assembly PilM family ATPase